MPNAEPAFTFTTRRTRVLQALGLIVPLSIAAASLYFVLGGSGGATRARGSTDLTSSAGSLAPDSVGFTPTATEASSSVLAAPVRPQELDRAGGITGGSSVSLAVPDKSDVAPTPRKAPAAPRARPGAPTTARTPSQPRRVTRVDSNRASTTARSTPPAIDSTSLRPVVPTPAPAADSRAGNDTAIEDPFKIPSTPGKPAPSGKEGAGPIPRCRIAAAADQRACLAAYIEIGDGPLNRTFDSLVSEMRRVARTPAGAADPQTVQRARVEQRAWLSVRDAECPRQAPPGGEPFWAQAQSECFTEMASARTRELQEAVRRLRRAK